MPLIYDTKALHTSPQSVQTAIDAKYKRTQDRALTLLVEMDEDETLDDVLEITPPRGTINIYDPTLWISKVTPRRITRKFCEVDIEWSPRPYGDAPDPEEHPASWAAKWLGSSTEKVSRVAYKDESGAVIEMTNGGLYSTPLETTVNVLVTRFRKYYWLILPGTVPPGTPTLDDYILLWNNAINSGTYRGQPKWTWQVTVSAAPEQVNGYDVAALTFELKYNPLTWVDERLQHDSWYLASGEKKLFRDSEGNPTTGNLNSAGGDGGTARFYKKHRMPKEINFGTLGF